MVIWWGALGWLILLFGLLSKTAVAATVLVVSLTNQTSMIQGLFKVGPGAELSRERERERETDRDREGLTI